MSEKASPTKLDEAAFRLVGELLNTAAVLEFLWNNLLGQLSPEDYPGEDLESVLLEMMVGSSLPALRRVGPRQCDLAADLVVGVRERVMDDLRLATELSARR